MNKLRRHTKRVMIGLVGGLVVLVGSVLVPYPGPGWLIVFSGLAILATEFAFAQKVLDYTKGKYDTWVAWMKQQSTPVQILVLALTGVVILATVYILNGFGIINNIFNLNHDWLISPLFG